MKTRNSIFSMLSYASVIKLLLKGTVMQTEKALMNVRLYVSKVSWKFRIPTMYNFAAIYP